MADTRADPGIATDVLGQMGLYRTCSCCPRRRSGRSSWWPRLIGWLWAIVLFVATSAVGLMLLRRSGRGDLDRLRAALAQDGIRAVHLEMPRRRPPMLGGILLVFPGFITDVAGRRLAPPGDPPMGQRQLAKPPGSDRRSRRGDDHRHRPRARRMAANPGCRPRSGSSNRPRAHNPAAPDGQVRGRGMSGGASLSGRSPCVSHAADCERIASGER